MPIGFAKSIFSTSAAAGAAAQGYSRGTGFTDSDTNYGYYEIKPNAGSTDLQDSNEFAFVIWFRLITSDYASGKEFMLPWQTNDGTRRVEIIFNNQNDGGGDANDHSISLNVTGSNQFRSYGSFTSGDDFFNGTTFGNDVADGSWHCLMTRFSATASNRQLYLDNVNIIKSQSTNVTAGSVPFSSASLDFNMSFFEGGFGGGGANFDIGPTWFYDSAVDFSSSTVRGYYYNASNTDGYVDGGTDGTSGGATQPDLYLYNPGTGLVNGGTAGTVTITKRTAGSGSVSDFDSTNGPGSGNVRS